MKIDNVLKSGWSEVKRAEPTFGGRFMSMFTESKVREIFRLADDFRREFLLFFVANAARVCRRKKPADGKHRPTTFANLRNSFFHWRLAAVYE